MDQDPPPPHSLLPAPKPNQPLPYPSQTGKQEKKDERTTCDPAAYPASLPQQAIRRVTLKPTPQSHSTCPARVVTQHAAPAPLSPPERPPTSPKATVAPRSAAIRQPGRRPADADSAAWHSSGYPGRWAAAKRATALSTGVCIETLCCMTGDDGSGETSSTTAAWPLHAVRASKCRALSICCSCEAHEGRRLARLLLSCSCSVFFLASLARPCLKRPVGGMDETGVCSLWWLRWWLPRGAEACTTMLRSSRHAMTKGRPYHPLRARRSRPRRPQAIDRSNETTDRLHELHNSSNPVEQKVQKTCNTHSIPKAANATTATVS